MAIQWEQIAGTTPMVFASVAIARNGYAWFVRTSASDPYSGYQMTSTSSRYSDR
ncbi:MAG: hypothetical protein I8H75_03720 [Myxococcaceae bacterium]|nr:hypothetical protein [Myxococcaceae bacterium]